MSAECRRKVFIIALPGPGPPDRLRLIKESANGSGERKIAVDLSAELAWKAGLRCAVLLPCRHGYEQFSSTRKRANIGMELANFLGGSETL